MKLIISTKLDILLEIPSLLLCTVDFESNKKILISELNKLNINGESFYSKNLKPLNRYLKTFRKHMIVNKDDMFFLGENDLFVRLTVLYVLFNNREIYNNIDSFSNNDLRLELLNSYNHSYETNFSNDILESFESMLSFVDESNLNEESKWKFILILQNPKKYYSRFIELINKNLDAYNKAIESVEKDLEILIGKYIKYIESDTHNILNSTFNKLTDTLTIIPSLVSASMVSAPNNTVYLGLYVESILNAKTKSMGSQGDLILKLKALSDKSKLDILLFLKSGSKYSLEIAEELNLTPATVSYHMSSLLDSSMVSLTKEDGKCYYHLETKGIDKLISELKSTFLN